MGNYHMLAQELGGLAAPLLGVLAGLIGLGVAYPGVSVALAVFSGVVLMRRL